jgi:hypothetical protein
MVPPHVVGEPPTHCPILQADLHPGHFVLYDLDQVSRIIETQVAAKINQPLLSTTRARFQKHAA